MHLYLFPLPGCMIGIATSDAPQEPQKPTIFHILYPSIDTTVVIIPAETLVQVRGHKHVLSFETSLPFYQRFPERLAYMSESYGIFSTILKKAASTAEKDVSSLEIVLPRLEQSGSTFSPGAWMDRAKAHYLIRRTTCYSGLKDALKATLEDRMDDSIKCGILELVFDYGYQFLGRIDSQVYIPPHALPFLTTAKAHAEEASHTAAYLIKLFRQLGHLHSLLAEKKYPAPLIVQPPQPSLRYR